MDGQDETNMPSKTNVPPICLQILRCWGHKNITSLDSVIKKKYIQSYEKKRTFMLTSAKNKNSIYMYIKSANLSVRCAPTNPPLFCLKTGFTGVFDFI